MIEQTDDGQDADFDAGLARLKQQLEQEAATQRQQAAIRARASQPASSGIGDFLSSIGGGIMSAKMGAAAGGGAASGGAAAGGEAAGGTAASGGMGNAVAAGGPWAALAAAITAHHLWAKDKGMHTNEDAILGRALYKDADWYQPRLNDKIGGLGDEVKLASLGSSPIDLFKGDTWSKAAKLGLSGGILGSLLKKIF
ncbi:hypothetical protein [Burkholderia multivorans]|uniref:hypothetical protein n=1 Tax=Burkholderia multivorans TaxID=87883 RepID=UPI001C233288|nr:hypothetical protein [Burkholderia multivorans]ULR75139.1 virion-associated protein [Burkholderia phage JC1]MBU9386653.1 hypothetical protein [Burkholderia multivorans]MBU9437087.1 hypothetical protein [Burkholderia multivorans]MBU9606292.1 hypothetical protein [Burkholderia multivorans]MBU9624851.1 hypothetical protein [Burkholderia multivorans]